MVVTVNQGVVKLSGETANDKKAVQAFNLANRLQGVVAVEDDISRTLSVEDNVTPVVNELMSKLKSWTKALLLLLIALLAFFGGGKRWQIFVKPYTVLAKSNPKSFCGGAVVWHGQICLYRAWLDFGLIAHGGSRRDWYFAWRCRYFGYCSGFCG